MIGKSSKKTSLDPKDYPTPRVLEPETLPEPSTVSVPPALKYPSSLVPQDSRFGVSVVLYFAKVEIIVTILIIR